MTRLALRIAVASALVVGAALAIFFGFVARNGAAAPCYACGLRLPFPLAVAKVPLPKGTSAAALDSKSLRWKEIPRSKFVAGMISDPREIRGEIAIHAIPAGTPLNASDFGLRGPIYYPRGYPRRIPASQVPGEMSRMIGPARAGQDIEVAPGVWIDGSTTDAALDTHVANGTLIGYCGSIHAFQAHNPDVPFATWCRGR